MEDLPRIRTPWKQQWRRIRYQLVPVLVMGVSLLATGWLWSRYTGVLSGLGVVDAVKREAISDADGMLVSPPGGAPNLYDNVEAEQVIALIDGRAVQAALEAVHEELARLEAEIPAKEEQLRVEASVRDESYLAEARRLAVQVETLRLGILDRQAMIETDRIELQRLTSVFDAIKALYGEKFASNREFLETQMKRDVIEKRLAGNEVSLVEAQAQLKAAEARARAMPTTRPTDFDKQLQPLRKAIATQEARLRELEVHAESLKIKAPVSGQIVDILRAPGQAVRRGDVIAIIAQGKGKQIASYVRADQRIRPEAGMLVEIRPRINGAKVAYSSFLEQVGPRVEPVPLQHQRDPRIPEWGVPVTIPIPTELRETLRPGEVVDVKIRPNLDSGN